MLKIGVWEERKGNMWFREEER